MERENEVLTYGFFLRFAKKNYIPCKKCQKRLHEIIMKSNWVISSPISVELDYTSTNVTNKEVTFSFNFLYENDSMPPSPVRWFPCNSCQPYLLNIVRKSELIMGNKEYTDPPVELWRKWIPKD